MRVRWSVGLGPLLATRIDIPEVLWRLRPTDSPIRHLDFYPPDRLRKTLSFPPAIALIDASIKATYVLVHEGCFLVVHLALVPDSKESLAALRVDPDGITRLVRFSGFTSVRPEYFNLAWLRYDYDAS